MTNTNYYVIHGWMINELKLTGNELLVYAIIYGFSQDGETEFNGSLSYMAEMTNSTKRTIINTLNTLEEKGLIRKKQYKTNNIVLNKYLATDIKGWCNNFAGGEKISLGGGEKISPNNDISKDISNSNNNIKEKDITKVISKEKFRKPTIPEIQDYCLERSNGIDAESFYDFYESKGWKVGNTPMKDWKACVRTWEKSRKNNGYKTKTQKVTDEMIDAINIWE